MADPPVKSKTGATPGKLALVAVLAVVFLSVLVIQFAGSDEPPAPRENVGAGGRADTPSTENGAGLPTPPPHNGEMPKQARQWPKFALEEVLRHDPFALPAALLPPVKRISADPPQEEADKARQQELQARREQREQALATIRRQGVQMVFLGQEDKVAIIANQRVRIGDLLEGFLVTEIDSDGVTLSEQE